LSSEKTSMPPIVYGKEICMGETYEEKNRKIEWFGKLPLPGEGKGD